MEIRGTYIHYYFNCHRQLWLFANGINMEQTSDEVSMGKLIHENAYLQRSERFREIEIGPIKIDYFDYQKKIIHEIKKSSKLFQSHEWQVKYYIYFLENYGIKDVSGILEYPKERKIEKVILTDSDRILFNDLLPKIRQLIQSENCPPVINKPKCKSCSYFDFCYSSD